MHRYTAWGLSAALLAGALAPPTFAADPAPRAAANEPDKKPWYGRLLGGDSAKKTAADEATFGEVPPRPPVVIAPLDTAVLTDALRAEQDAYLRRMAVCLKLREVADRLSDEKLTTEVDEVERQATALYHQRVARLGVKAPARVTTADPIDTAIPTVEPRQFREVKP